MQDINEIKEEPIKHVCDICGRKFKSDNGYSVHKFKHSLIGKLVCPVCGVDFKEADMRFFNAHIAKHYKDEKYKEIKI